MSGLEAVVWITGIIAAGITVCSVANAFSRAAQTVKLSKIEFGKKDENDNESDSQDS